MLNAVGRSVDIGLITPIAVGSLFMVVGNYLGTVRSNFFFGVRTPWTLSSERSWSKTHRLAGRLFVVVGFVLVLTALLGGRTPSLWVLVIGTSAVALGTILYSYFVWRADPAKHAIGR